ncbi:HIT domain-containing protein [Catellatospora sp. NPDC049133]|jgi:diadenosine tetraphosphate (Ap4A) HIT family hydrolase|uniref:HIT family protein n=1 Tax=Catellatospora sp. NPDC049133 TaxID=3155499 RepID=UPI0033F70DF9
MLYNIANYRTDEQRSKMIRLEENGICIFCADHLIGDPARLPVWRNTHWAVVPNDFPYKGTRRHLLLVPDEHVSDLVELSPAAKEDFWAALGWVRDHYEMTYYGLGVRNGDCRFTGGTVSHLHVHVVVGDVDDPEHEPVRMKFSSRPPEQTGSTP